MLFVDFHLGLILSSIYNVISVASTVPDGFTKQAGFANAAPFNPGSLVEKLD
jgi:hypothetical protein